MLPSSTRTPRPRPPFPAWLLSVVPGMAVGLRRPKWEPQLAPSEGRLAELCRLRLSGTEIFQAAHVCAERVSAALRVAPLGVGVAEGPRAALPSRAVPLHAGTGPPAVERGSSGAVSFHRDLPCFLLGISLVLHRDLCLTTCLQVWSRCPEPGGHQAVGNPCPPRLQAEQGRGRDLLLPKPLPHVREQREGSRNGGHPWF